MCALESEKLQPAFPGGKRGPRKESGGRGAGRGADAPRGPPTGALGVRRARASCHPLLFSPLRSSPGRRLTDGGAIHTLAGAPGCCAPVREPPGSPSHSPQQQEPSNSAATKGHISAPSPGGRRRRCLEPPPPPLSSGERPASSAAAVTGWNGRPGCPGARARVSVARSPLPRPASERAAHAHSAPPGRLCSLT